MHSTFSELKKLSIAALSKQVPGRLLVHSPAHDSAREQVHHHRQEQPPPVGADVGNVGGPPLVWTRGGEVLLKQVVGHSFGPGLTTLRLPLASIRTLEAVLTHQALQLGLVARYLTVAGEGEGRFVLELTLPAINILGADAQIAGYLSGHISLSRTSRTASSLNSLGNTVRFLLAIRDTSGGRVYHLISVSTKPGEDQPQPSENKADFTTRTIIATTSVLACLRPGTVPLHHIVNVPWASKPANEKPGH